MNFKLIFSLFYEWVGVSTSKSQSPCEVVPIIVCALFACLLVYRLRKKKSNIIEKIRGDLTLIQPRNVIHR